MRRQRWIVLWTLVAQLSALVGLAALAAGGSTPFGTRTAGERATFATAAAAALVSGIVLLVMRRKSSHLDVVGHALSGLAAAVALSLPAVWAFAYPVTTPADDTSGCGTISSPTKTVAAAGTLRLTPTCAERLREQKLYVAGLGALPAVVAARALRAGTRRVAARG